MNRDLKISYFWYFAGSRFVLRRKNNLTKGFSFYIDQIVKKLKD